MNYAKFLVSLVVLLTLIFPQITSAQEPQQVEQKVVYVDAQAIIPEMPTYKRAVSELDTYKENLQRQLDARTKALESYTSAIIEGAELLGDGEMREEQTKIAQMRQDLQKVYAKSQENLAKKEENLLVPVYEKFNEALQAVAAANGYDYVFDKKLLLYYEGGTDATQQVKAKLGI